MCNLSEAILERGQEEGRIEGRQEGRQEGELIMLYRLVKDRDLSISAALRQAGKYGITTEAEFRRKAAEAGYTI